MPKAVFYQSIGPELARYDIDVEGAALTRRDAVTIARRQRAICLAASVEEISLCGVERRRAGHHSRHQAYRHRVPHRSGVRRADAARRHRLAAVAAGALQRRPLGRISADRVQLSEQHHGPPHQAGRHARRSGRAAREARRRHFRPSGPDHAGQPDRDHGDARQQSRGGRSPRTPARSRSMASRTAC